MTLTATEKPRQGIELRQGEQACIPVPEGRVTVESQSMANGLAHQVVVLHPHGDAAPHELARFANGSFDISQMVLVALAALEAWR